MLVSMVVGSGEAVADDPSRHLIYLHGRIVQLQQDARPVHPRFGAYELDAIVAAFREKGFEVTAEIRPASATEAESAGHVVEQVRALLADGVAGDRIVIVGASAGGGVALRASAQLQHPEVRFAILGNCLTTLAARVEEDEGRSPAGRLVSIRETSDSLTEGCVPWSTTSGAFAAREVVIDTGLDHGFLYRPLKSWIDPVIALAFEEVPGR